MKNFKYFCVLLSFMSMSVFADVHRSDYANVERQKIAQLENSDFRNPYLKSSMNNYEVKYRNDAEERQAMADIRKKYRVQNQSYSNYDNRYNQRSRNEDYSNQYYGDNDYNYQRNENYNIRQQDYQNDYREVRKDSTGKVVQVMQNEQCYTHNDTSNGKQLTGALIGGAIGNQFGSGNGRAAMTATGAIVGAGMAQNSYEDCNPIYTMVVERQLRVNGQTEVEYLQFNSEMPIEIGTRVRLNN